MAVPFNPYEKNEDIEQMADRILEIASKNLQLDDYEQAELHFYQAVPEQQIIMRDVTRDVKTWIKNH